MKVWDLHCDTLYELRRAEKAGAPKSFLHNDLHIDLEKLQQGDYLLQCFAAYVDLADPAPGADPLVSVLEEIDIFKRLMAAYPEKIAPVYTAADLERNRAEGKFSAMLTVEEGGCCKGSLGVLRRLQELGVRMMTLTWNYPNELAAPNANPGGPLVANTETGLTEQGHRKPQHPSLCGKPFQLPCPVAPQPQPDRRDDPRTGRKGRHCRAELLRFLCGRRLGTPQALPQHGGTAGKARGTLQAGGRH